MKIRHINGKLELTAELKHKIKDFEEEFAYRGAALFQIHSDGNFRGLLIPSNRYHEVCEVLTPFCLEAMENEKDD